MGDSETLENIVPMSERLNEAKAVDAAVYGAIAASETPSLDIVAADVLAGAFIGVSAAELAGLLDRR